MQNVVIQKNELKRVMAAGVYPSEAPSPTRFLFGMVYQFCRFWIWVDTECTTLAEYGLQQNPKPPLPFHTVYLFTQGRGGGELNKREGERGNSLQNWVENTNMTKWNQEINYIQSKNYDKHLQQSPSTG